MRPGAIRVPEVANRDFDVAMVGAGIAGVAAAQALLGAGCRVLVLDKAKSVGGRCATRRLEAATDAPWMDLGAQYFTARTPEFRAAIDPLIASGALRAWRPRLARQQDGVLLASGDATERWVGVRGMNSFVRSMLAGSASDGLELRLNARVCGVERRGGQWQLLDERGEIGRAASLLITAPGPQALGLLPDEWRSAVPAVAMQPCLALGIEIARSLPFDAVFCDGRVLSWMARNASKAGQQDQAFSLWTLHAAAGFSRDAAAADAVLTEQILCECGRLFGLSRGELKIRHRHLWRYARPASWECATSQGMLHWPESQLALAGDWLNGGRVEGAWCSGRQAALALLSAA